MLFHGEIEGMLPAEILESGWCEEREFDVLKIYKTGQLVIEIRNKWW